jgi:hypothetical protein
MSPKCPTVLPTSLELVEPDTCLLLLRDVVARVVAAREEIEIGDGVAARLILFDLEVDLAVLVEQGPRR